MRTTTLFEDYTATTTATTDEGEGDDESEDDDREEDEDDELQIYLKSLQDKLQAKPTAVAAVVVVAPSSHPTSLKARTTSSTIKAAAASVKSSIPPISVYLKQRDNRDNQVALAASSTSPPRQQKEQPPSSSYLKNPQGVDATYTDGKTKKKDGNTTQEVMSDILLESSISSFDHDDIESFKDHNKDLEEEEDSSIVESIHESIEDDEDLFGSEDITQQKEVPVLQTQRLPHYSNDQQMAHKSQEQTTFQRRLPMATIPDKPTPSTQNAKPAIKETLQGPPPSVEEANEGKCKYCHCQVDGARTSKKNQETADINSLEKEIGKLSSKEGDRDLKKDGLKLSDPSPVGGGERLSIDPFIENQIQLVLSLVEKSGALLESSFAETRMPYITLEETKKFLLKERRKRSNAGGEGGGGVGLND